MKPGFYLGVCGHNGIEIQMRIQSFFNPIWNGYLYVKKILTMINHDVSHKLTKSR